MSQFFGEVDQLKQLVENAGYVGVWQHKEANNCHSFKARTGEMLNWWPGTGTVQFQGKSSDAMKAQILPLLGGPVAPAQPVENVAEKKIFIVHGHDSDARDQLELILRRLGLEPFILQNSEAGSKTLVEALEASIYKETGLGIILMTPDDYGYSKSQSEADRQPRARQNVILEMGMVMASLGRGRMLILKKGALELPSDAAGIQYHEFNDHVREIVPKLVQRLQQLGFKIDTSKIAEASA